MADVISPVVVEFRLPRRDGKFNGLHHVKITVDRRGMPWRAECSCGYVVSGAGKDVLDRSAVHDLNEATP